MLSNDKCYTSFFDRPAYFYFHNLTLGIITIVEIQPLFTLDLGYYQGYCYI